MLNLGGEIIYPEPEVTGSTIILMLANGFTFIMAEILSHLTLTYNIIYRNDLFSRSIPYHTNFNLNIPYKVLDTAFSFLKYFKEHLKFNFYWNGSYYWFDYAVICQTNFESTKCWSNKEKQQPWKYRSCLNAQSDK